MSTLLYAQTRKQRQAAIADGPSFPISCARLVGTISVKEESNAALYARARRLATDAPLRHVMDIETGTVYLWFGSIAPMEIYTDDQQAEFMRPIGRLGRSHRLQPVEVFRHNRTGCVCVAHGDTYTMRGPTGSHSMSISCTPPDRLNAHWKGFIENNRRETGVEGGTLCSA